MTSTRANNVKDVPPRRLKVVLSVNAAWNVVNFRRGLIRGLQRAGHEVVVLAPDDGYAAQVRALNVRFVSIALDRKGLNPFAELRTLWRYRQVLREERPDAYLGFTIKPNIYGSLVCHALKIPTINNIAGLGSCFARADLFSRMIRGLYRRALGHSKHVFFQNDEDCKAFVSSGVVTARQSSRLPGSGIDLEAFPETPLPSAEGLGPVRFLLSARMLWDKGVGTFVESVRLLRNQGVEIDARVVGFVDDGNPGAIPIAQIRAWHEEGVIRYLGEVTDIRPSIADVDCVVLPSTYREGVPRALLEAASMARPLVTTDSVGCRDALDDGVSGFLTQARDPQDLASKMKAIIDMPSEARVEMGKRSRAKMVRQFDEQLVVSFYINALNTLGLKKVVSKRHVKNSIESIFPATQDTRY